MEQVICSVYRSKKKEGMYLYVEKSKGLEMIPETLKALFGEPVQALTLVLNSERKLAQVDCKKVLEKLKEDGYFLQMPPGPETYMQLVNSKNSKI